MQTRFLITMFLLITTVQSLHAQQADSFRTAPRTINLNDIVVRPTAEKKYKRKTSVDNVSLVFNSSQSLNSRSWDSTYLLTRFPTPTTKPFLLSAVEGRIGDYDTSRFDLFLVVMQLNEKDTIFKEIPITLATAKRKKQAHLMDVRDADILLQPTTFYLGYGFHSRPGPEEYRYRLYSTDGGQGVFLSRRNNEWRFSSNSSYPYVFPFTISYVER